MTNDDSFDGDEKEFTVKEVYRPIKRVRQACAVCRGRKVRCTGERPSCAVCIRSGHDCNYIDNGAGNQTGEAAAPAVIDSRSYTTTVTEGTFASDSNEQLAIRVSLLERQLNELTKNLKSTSCDGDELQSPITRSETDKLHNNRNARQELLHKSAKLFVDLPPREIVHSLIDTFFIRSYNQPYLFSHEQTFRRRLDERTVPDFLIFALIATVLRFSKCPYFLGKEMEAAESYATQSWRLMASCWTGDHVEFDVDSIYALIFLSSYDLTAGRRQNAWLKLGIVIRIAQDLGLSKEPDANLPIIVQEERRRVFWTVYMLDKFSLCGCDRPPAISDSDCKVSLPCDETTFQKGNEENPGAYLDRMFHHKPQSDKPNSFALSIFMASTLGTIARYMFREETDAEPLALWDLRSQYSVTSSQLMMFESHFNRDISFHKIVERDFTNNGVIDHQRIGHVILSNVLFHLCYCLLNHPLLLRHRLARFPPNQVPQSFLSRAIQNCTEHAMAISKFVREAKASGCNTSMPYFCYGIGICASVHALNLYNTDHNTRTVALACFEILCDYLRDWACLKYARNVLSILETLKQESHRYQWLLTPSKLLSSTVEPSKPEILWRLLNFAALANSEPSAALDIRDSMSRPQQVTTSDTTTLGTAVIPPTPPFDCTSNQAVATPATTEPSSFGFLDLFQSSDWGGYVGAGANDISLMFEEAEFPR